MWLSNKWSVGRAEKIKYNGTKKKNSAEIKTKLSENEETYTRKDYDRSLPPILPILGYFLIVGIILAVLYNIVAFLDLTFGNNADMKPNDYNSTKMILTIMAIVGSLVMGVIFWVIAWLKENVLE